MRPREDARAKDKEPQPMNRIAAITFLSLTLSGLPAYASETSAADATATAAVIDGAIAPVADAAAPATTDRMLSASSVSATLTGREWVAANRRPSLLPGLYASFAALQMFDVYSTQRALAGGAREANPMMKTVVGNKPTFYAVKAVSTVAPMLLAERLWKQNKIAAIAVMAASNGIMAAVATHNASVLKSQR